MNDDESLLYERLYNYAHITRREHANNMPNFEKCIQQPRRICIKLDRCTPRYAKHWTSRTCMADGRHTTRFVPPSTAQHQHTSVRAMCARIRECMRFTIRRARTSPKGISVQSSTFLCGAPTEQRALGQCTERAERAKHGRAAINWKSFVHTRKTTFIQNAQIIQNQLRRIYEAPTATQIDADACPPLGTYYNDQ